MDDNKISEIRLIRENPRFRRYPEYKESGVDWIGKIPRHWRVKKLKNISKIVASYVDKHINPDEIQVNLCNYTDVYYHEKIDSSIDFMKGSCNHDEHERSLIRKGDVIITKDSESADDIGVPAFIQEELANVVCGYHLSIIRPLNEIDGKFLFRFIQSKRVGRYFEANSTGITRFSLGKSIIENLSTVLPLLSEQRQIANFLDRKTEQIDELIRIKERRIELLQEQRTALINQTVTKGLDPNVEMKQSGVEWIGEIPVHWKVKKLKYISKIVASYVDKHIKSDEIQVNLCNYTDVYYHEKIDSSIDFMKGSCNHDEYERSLIQKGDVIITKDSESADDIGVPAFTQEELANVVCGYHLSIIRPLNIIDGKFLFRFIQSKRIGRYFEVNSTGITRFSLGKSIIENLSTVLPPLSEQIQIADFLDRKTEQIDELTSTEQRKIELLKEYRQSFISEAVTGKIDVQNEV